MFYGPGGERMGTYRRAVSSPEWRSVGAGRRRGSGETGVGGRLGDRAGPAGDGGGEWRRAVEFLAVW